MNLSHKIIHHFPLPYLGHRIIKTSIAVFLCLSFQELIKHDGMALQSAIAAIVCIQPYIEDTKKFAFDRIAGTFLGAFFGLLFLLCMDNLPSIFSFKYILYAIISIGVLISIYSTVILNLKDSASLAAIVFLSIIIMYPNIDNPINQATSRLIDTAIGVTFAILVNIVKLPRGKNTDILFFIRMQDIVPDRFSTISSGVLITLNRMYQDGAKICIVSKWAPAFLLSQMESIQTTTPAIVMDGAAIYDIVIKNIKLYKIIIRIIFKF